MSKVFTFDDKCYDCGIQDKILIALPRLDSVASRFAQNQRIKVFDNESLKAFLALPLPAKQIKKNISFSPNTKTEVAQILSQLGYEIEEKAKVRGRSGAEYTFDILASLDDGFIAHKLGIDEMTGDEVSLNQISLFDTKAYDTGVQKKALLISGKFTLEAKQFAEQQRIKVIKLGRQDQRLAAEKEKAPSLQNAIEELLTVVPKVKPREKLLKRIPQSEVLQLIPETMARKFNAMPLAIVDNALQVATANPADIFALEALALQSKMRIDPIAASEREIREAIDFNYKGFGQIEEQVSRIPTGAEAVDEQALIEAAEDTPVASVLRLIIDEAIKARASDVHIEPEEDRLRIRYRIDGALQDVMSLPLKIHLPPHLENKDNG